MLLAKLMTKPANVIVLDEPTNDLDAETLELLEEQLIDFGGTLLMVSHDRAFLNNVVTSTIVFESDGVREYAGGYDEWQAAVRRRQETEPTTSREQSKETSDKPKPSKRTPSDTRKLSYNEQRELDQLPGRIESLESDIETIHQTMQSEEYYQRGGEAIAADAARLKQLEGELAEAYQRWEQLED